MFTRNTSDFAAIHWRWMAEGRDHAGVIVLTDQRMPVGALLNAMRELRAQPGSMKHRLVYLRNFLTRD